MRYNPLKPNKTARPARPKPLAKGVVPSPEPVSRVPTLSENGVKGRPGICVSPTRPDAATLAAFHATRDLPRDEQWHWHRHGGFWYARRNDRSRLFAITLIAPITASLAPAPTSDVGVSIFPTPVALPDPPPTPAPVQVSVPSAPSCSNPIPARRYRHRRGLCPRRRPARQMASSMTRRSTPTTR